MDDTAAREFAIEAAKKTAELMGLKLDPAVIEIATQGAHTLVNALGGAVYRELHAQAVAKAQELKSVEDAERSRKERLADR